MSSYAYQETAYDDVPFVPLVTYLRADLSDSDTAASGLSSAKYLGLSSAVVNGIRARYAWVEVGCESLAGGDGTSFVAATFNGFLADHTIEDANRVPMNSTSPTALVGSNNQTVNIAAGSLVDHIVGFWCFNSLWSTSTIVLKNVPLRDQVAVRASRPAGASYSAGTVYMNRITLYK